MKKRIVSLLCASAMLLCLASAGCGGASSDNSGAASGSTVTSGTADNGGDGNSVQKAEQYSQNITAFTYKGMTLYNNGHEIYDVTVPDKPVFPDFKGDAPELNKDETSEKSESSASSYKGQENYPSILLAINGNTVIDGNDIYARSHGDEPKIYRFDMSDPQNIKQKVLFESEEELDIVRKAVKNKLGSYKSYSDEDIDDAVYSLVCCSKEWIDGGDGYIYFWSAMPNEYAYSFAPLSYVVCRFAKDGSAFEIMGDGVNACSIAYKDGYLYYLDNGYCINAEKKSEYIDVNNMGIYRVRPDGTGKEKLASAASQQYIGAASEVSPNQIPSGGILKISGEYLYYIIQETPDLSEGTFLYKLPLSGGTPEKAVNEPVSYYYIDEASGMLYYQDGSMNLYDPQKSNTFYSVSLSGGEKKALFGKKAYNNGIEISVAGDYLYISDYNIFGWRCLYDDNKYEVSRPAGQRYNLSTGVFEYLECYNEAVTEETMFGEKLKELGPLNIAWKEYEDSKIMTDDKGVKVYR